LYNHSTFSPSTTDDAERDEVLTQKIRIFRWVKPEHLDIPDNPHNAAYLDKAQAGTNFIGLSHCDIETAHATNGQC
jgi:hypothetical protein